MSIRIPFFSSTPASPPPGTSTAPRQPMAMQMMVPMTATGPLFATSVAPPAPGPTSVATQSAAPTSGWAATTPRQQVRIVAEAQQVSRVYGQGEAAVRAVDGISVAFMQGELAAIVGPSGSGKSTLMHLLAGLDQPTSGATFLDGMPLAGRHEAELAELRRTRMGFVFQSFNLLPGLTVLENIRLPETLGTGATTATNDRAWEGELIARLGLLGLLERMPHQLSGGQQQRVAIVRALAHRPAVVFADEPTGNLDVVSGAEVLKVLSSLAHDAGCGIVIVTHDAAAASVADRILYVRDGRVVQEIGRSSAEEIAHFLVRGGAL